MRGFLSKRFVRPGSRFRRCQDGATAVEFAFMALPFFALLLVVFETGLMLFTEYMIENGVAKAARMIRTGQVQAEGMSAGQFKSVVCGNLLAYIDCDGKLYIDVRSFETFAGISTPSAISDDGELTEDVTVNSKFEPGEPMEVVVVRAYYDWTLLVPGLSMLSNLADGRRLLAAGAAFRNEPFPD